MAIVIPAKGQPDWDVTLNAALVELESEITSNASKINGVTITNNPVANQTLVAADTTQAAWTTVTSVDLTSDQTIAGNKTFTYYTTIQDGQVNGAVHFNGTVGAFGATPVGRQTVTGSRGGNAALASLITALATLGLITDNTTA